MKTAKPELGFERVLAALGQDLLDATDEEIQSVANELGMKPGMKGSIALFGVTFGARLNIPHAKQERQAKKATCRTSATRSRRRPKGDAPSSS